MSNSLLPFLGWSFLPDLITGQVQSFYYNFSIRAGAPKPQPGSPTFAKHRRRIHAAVILIYLLYTLIEAQWEIRRASDFYADLGVAHDVEEKALQSRFRKLTLLHHPDKIANPEARSSAEKYYVHLTLARDTLLDPAKRFAYDRFGPNVVQWQQCKTKADFVLAGTQAFIPFYAMSSALMIGLGYLGFFDWGKYWRYLAFLTLAAFELHTITQPSPPVLARFPLAINPIVAAAGFKPLPPYVPFQLIQLLHRSLVTLTIALNRLGPLLKSGDGAANDASGQERALQQVEQLVNATRLEASRLLALDLAPFAGHDDVAEAGNRANGGIGSTRSPGLKALREKIKEWFVVNTIRQQKEVQDAVRQVVQSRQQQRPIASI